MHLHGDDLAAIQPFLQDGLIDEVLFAVKSGKEATVYCCRSAAKDLPPLVAVKAYRASEQRTFRRDEIYLAGRVEHAKNTRMRRALRANSAFGRTVAATLWVMHEWELLTRLAAAELPVPEPLACGSAAIMMGYLGDERAPAPTLREVDLPRERIELVTDDLLGMVAAMLNEHCVHGDLSAYNIIWWGDRPMLIDLPQAVDPRLNPAAESLLSRDVANICAWAAKQGVQRPADAIARDLWTRFTLGEIG